MRHPKRNGPRYDRFDWNPGNRTQRRADARCRLECAARDAYNVEPLPGETTKALRARCRAVLTGVNEACREAAEDAARSVVAAGLSTSPESRV